MLEACRGSTSQSGVFYLQQPTVIQFRVFSKRYKELIIVKKFIISLLCVKIYKRIFKYLFIILLTISSDTIG